MGNMTLATKYISIELEVSTAFRSGFMGPKVTDRWTDGTIEGELCNSRDVFCRAE